MSESKFEPDTPLAVSALAAFLVSAVLVDDLLVLLLVFDLDFLADG